jgi:hypothetical protein
VPLGKEAGVIVNGRIDDCDPPPHRDKIPMVVRHERRMIKRTIGFIKFPCPDSLDDFLRP